MVVLQVFVTLVCPRQEVSSGSFYSSILANPSPLFQLYVSHIYSRTHSSTLAWKISWVEECSRLQSTGSQRVGHKWLHFKLVYVYRNKKLARILTGIAPTYRKFRGKLTFLLCYIFPSMNIINLSFRSPFNFFHQHFVSFKIDPEHIFKFIFNWRIIVLLYCVSFCHTSTWISHRYTYVPPPTWSHPSRLSEPQFELRVIQQIPTGHLFYAWYCICFRATLSVHPIHRSCTCFGTAAAKLLQWCPTLCNPADSRAGSLVPGLLQARVLEWVAIAFSDMFWYIYI